MSRRWFDALFCGQDISDVGGNESTTGETFITAYASDTSIGIIDSTSGEIANVSDRLQMSAYIDSGVQGTNSPDDPDITVLEIEPLVLYMPKPHPACLDQAFYMPHLQVIYETSLWGTQSGESVEVHVEG